MDILFSFLMLKTRIISFLHYNHYRAGSTPSCCAPSAWKSLHIPCFFFTAPAARIRYFNEPMRFFFIIVLVLRNNIIVKASSTVFFLFFIFFFYSFQSGHGGFGGETEQRDVGADQREAQRVHDGRITVLGRLDDTGRDGRDAQRQRATVPGQGAVTAIPARRGPGKVSVVLGSAGVRSHRSDRHIGKKSPAFKFPGDSGSGIFLISGCGVISPSSPPPNTIG